MDASLAKLDATAQRELVTRGEISPDELASEALARIAALNPLLRAVVTVDESARGIPFLAKDTLFWPGLRCSFGARVFRGNVAQQHVPYGRRLAEAGFACVGKSAMSELGLLGSTETLLEGATHNPWDLSLSAAGSSGGSAAAVAAGLVPVAHANDGGGSIRIPASVNGVFGFKPSRGRTVPAAMGDSDFLALTSDHCVSRSVRDSVAFLELTAESPLGPVAPVTRPLRIATWTKTPFHEEPEPNVRRAHDGVLKLLEGLGHRVEPVTPPAYDGPAYGDAFFVVAAAAVAGVVALVDGMRGEPVQRDELEPFSWALVDDLRARGPGALEKARAALAQAAKLYDEVTRAFDVVVTPVTAVARWPIGHLSPLWSREVLFARTARIVGYTPAQNVAGCPAMSVPLSVDDDGFPIGAHFAAAPGSDELLLSLALQLEEARPWKDRWPPVSIPALAR